MVVVGSGLILFGLVFTLWVSGADERVDQNRNDVITVVPAKVEFPAPELSLYDLDGRIVSLADYKGKVIFVNNWATWCPPCKAEMPTLQAFYEDHKDQGFELIAIDAGDSPEIVGEFAKQYGLTFRVWLDPSSEALSVFRNNALPSTYVIDREGIVRLAWNGAADRSMLEKAITPLLED
jgi:peroxiredoxin